MDIEAGGDCQRIALSDRWVRICGISLVICEITLLLISGGCAPRHRPSQPHAAATTTSSFPFPRVSNLIFQEPFDRLDSERWREVAIHGRTRYGIEQLDGLSSLQALSQSGASILLTPLHVDPAHHPWISWRWRVDRFVQGENLSLKQGSDASARVYVYFESSGLPWQKRNLDYVWSATLPVDTVLESPYSRNSKILVVESGREHLGSWQTVKRNVTEDYRRCFEDDPPMIVAIGLMTDTDSTQTEALAYYDDLTITREPPAPELASSWPGSVPLLAGTLPDDILSSRQSVP